MYVDLCTYEASKNVYTYSLDNGDNLTLLTHIHEYEASDITTSLSKYKALEDTQKHKHIREFCSRREQKLT
jgi:hypothetical protein